MSEGSQRSSGVKDEGQVESPRALSMKIERSADPV